MKKTSITALLFVATLGGTAAAQSLRGKEAFGDWQHDKPGTIRLIKPEDLPKPGATSSAAKFSRVVPRPPDAAPQVPPGFKVELFAEGLSGPRIIRVAPNGDILVAETRAGRIRVLRSADGAAKPVANVVFASDLHSPFGIAFFPPGDNPQWMYVANTDSVVRFAYHSGDLKASTPPETVVANLPRGGGHTTRDIAFTTDGKRLPEGLRHGAGGMRWVPPGVMRPIARRCCRSIPMAKTRKYLPPESVIASALRSSRRAARPGAPPTNATALVTTWCPIT